MNNYIPTKVRDLTESKLRVMQNVVNEIENNSKRPKHQWRYVMISAVLIMSTMFFVFNEVLIENEPSPSQPSPSNELQSPTEQHVDFTKPTFTDEQGTLYIQGITLGESQEEIIEVLGEDYTIVKQDDSEADVIMDYDGQARFYFNENKLNSAVFMNVDKKYFDELFKDYDGFKFFTSIYGNYDGHYFYTNETKQVLKASMEAGDGNLQLSLYYHDPKFFINAEYLYMTEQKLNDQYQAQSDSTIDLVNPTFSEEQGHLYLNGVTIGDSPSKVLERFGDNYIIGQVDGHGSFVVDYDKQASFSFYEDKLISVVLTKVDKNYFEQLFNEHDGIKFTDSMNNHNRYIYSRETHQILKATTDVPSRDLYLYLFNPGPEIMENPDFLKATQK